jgi:hypothetical protein
MEAANAGVIINFGSVSWIAGQGGMAVYTASARFLRRIPSLQRRMSVLWAVSEGHDPALIEQAPSIDGAGVNSASRRDRLGDQPGNKAALYLLGGLQKTASTKSPGVTPFPRVFVPSRSGKSRASSSSAITLCSDRPLTVSPGSIEASAIQGMPIKSREFAL